MLAQAVACEGNPVFILGAPRTGSTFFYQAMIEALGLPYISNFTNAHFTHQPVLGLTVQRSVQPDMCWTSRYGKTEGVFGPSEGSAVMSYWFGGGHPSQMKSREILPDKRQHFIATMAAASQIFEGRPLLIKNAWNCFRIQSLAELLPKARFVWIRRDIRASALSDLVARYLTKGDPHIWNSATPANVEWLKKLPPWQQVVENQYEFNCAIGDALADLEDNRWRIIWYESLRKNPDACISELASWLQLIPESLSGVVDVKRNIIDRVYEDEARLIDAFVETDIERLSAHCHPTNEEN